jgi:hypothetical protein
MTKSNDKVRPLPKSWAQLNALAEAYEEAEPIGTERAKSPGLTSLYDFNKKRVVEAIANGETSS